MTEVLVRVSYQLVRLYYRRDPAAFRVHPPTSVFALGEKLRAEGFVNLYWTLNGCARWLAAGHTMLSWRAEASSLAGVRAFHKRSSRGRP